MTKKPYPYRQLSVVHRVKILNRYGCSKFFLVLSLCCLIFVAVLGVLSLITKPQRISASSSNDPPTLTAISPTEAYNWQPTTVTITGTGFFTITGTGSIFPTAYLGNVSLVDVAFVNSTTLTATVPADLPGGVYTLTVTNPDGQSATLEDAFTVLLSNDGSLDLWQEMAPMTTPRAYLTAIAVQGFLYALGGYNYSGYLSSVERAAINSDGSLSAWEAVASMTTPRWRPGAVVVGNYIYVLGGSSTGGGPLDSVERAQVNPDGSLGPWQAMTSMTTQRHEPAAVAAGGYIYVLGGSNSSGFLNSVERAKVNHDGSLGSWQMASSMITARRGLAAVSVGGYVYALGGYDVHSSPLNSVERAAINPDGSLGPWQSVTPMNKQRYGPAAVSARGYLYALGGWGRDSGLSDVERVAVNPDGSLGSWQAVTSMTTDRSSLASVATDGYIYALGGWTGASSTLISSVERAEIVDDMLPTGYGVTINDGALFTNQVSVTLEIGFEPTTMQMQVSNDGGFAGAVWEPYAPIKAWEITRYGDYVIPRVVYVRYKERNGNMSAAYQDDIILDVTAPTGSVEVVPGVSGSNARTVGVEAVALRPVAISATDSYSYTVYLPVVLKNFYCPPTGPVNVTLRLQAEDDVSGVADMMISNHIGFGCAMWEPYTAAKEWYVPEGATTTVYVKFRDNAGNVSEVVTDSITMPLQWLSSPAP